MLLLIILSLAAILGFAIYKVYYPKIETTINTNSAIVKADVASVELFVEKV